MTDNPTALRGNVHDLLTRYHQLAIEEMEHGELNWWWLSFSGEGEFHGVVIVYAHGLLEAVRVCHEQRLSLGGEVVGAPIPEEMVPAEKYRHKLLDEKLIKECMPTAVQIDLDKPPIPMITKGTNTVN